MTIQESQKLLRKLIQAKDEDELQKICCQQRYVV